MNFRSQTSLIALVLSVGVSQAIAAPTVRSLGGPSVAVGATTTAPASNAPATTPKATGTSSRAGSLRTGGFVTSPTVKTSASGGGTSEVAQSAPTGGSVSLGGGALNSRVSSTPRLSAGRYIGAPGKSISSEVPEVDLSGKVDKDQGVSEAGKALVVGDDGYVTTGEIVTPQDVTDIVNNITDGLETDISGKVDKLQETGAGLALVVDPEDNILKPTGDFVDKFQGGEKIDGEYENVGKALVVNEEGKVEARDEFVKLDQGDTNEDRVLTVGSDGKVAPGKIVYSQTETDDLLDTKLDNTADRLLKGKALIVMDNGEILPKGDFVEKFQGKNVSGRALIVDDDGYVTTGRINVDSLGLKHLAYEDTVRNELVDDNTLERAKMAASITDTLDWVDAWKNQAEDSPDQDDYKLNPNERYVMALDEFGQKAWFRVATE